jgi:hypothetical protein
MKELSAISCQLSAISYQPSAVSHRFLLGRRFDHAYASTHRHARDKPRHDEKQDVDWLTADS